MLIPLGVLAVGSVFAGMIWYGVFFGDHHRMNAWFAIPAAHEEAGSVEPEAADAGVAPQAVEQAEAEAEAPAAEHADAAAAEAHAGPIGAVFFGPDNHVIERAHEAPAWVKASPFFAMLIGAAVAYWFYIVNPSLPVALARNQPVLYRFLLNKWYFDEIYDSSSCGRRAGSATSCGRGATWARSTGR